MPTFILLCMLQTQPPQDIQYQCEFKTEGPQKEIGGKSEYSTAIQKKKMLIYSSGDGDYFHKLIALSQHEQNCDIELSAGDIYNEGFDKCTSVCILTILPIVKSVKTSYACRLPF